MRSYGFWTFACLQAEREAARISRFGERWQRLVEIQKLILKDFFEPLARVEYEMTDSEICKLTEYMDVCNEWLVAIDNDVDNARQNHLGRYATSLKTVATKSIGLCKKYKIYGDIHSFGYDSKKKTVLLNGIDLYYLG